MTADAIMGWMFLGAIAGVAATLAAVAIASHLAARQKSRNANQLDRPK